MTTVDQRKPVMPPPMSRLAYRARNMGYGAPDVELGDVTNGPVRIPIVRVRLTGSPMFRDVEAVCVISEQVQRNGEQLNLKPSEAEYIATRSALAEAIVLAMHPDARRHPKGAS